MGKVDEALSILGAFGLPRAQRNERSALTLLALIDLKESMGSGVRSCNITFTSGRHPQKGWSFPNERINA